MKLLLTLALTSVVSLSAYGLTTQEAELEYQSFTEDIGEADDNEIDLIDGRGLTNHHKKILVDSVWDFTANPENSKRLSSALRAWSSIEFSAMPLAEQVRLFVLGHRLKGNNARLELMKTILLRKIKGQLDQRSLFILFNHAAFLREQGLDQSLDQVEVANLKVKLEYDLVVKSSKEKISPAALGELLSIEKKLPKQTFLYVLCRSDRNQPCLLLLKDKKGNRTLELPVLAKSKLGLGAHFENGNTPSGLYHVESVMPTVDSVAEYGKNRRLILRMASKETAQKLLPVSQLKRSWWRQTLLAMAVGRENLRIHGTGKVNKDPETKHPTLVPSFGCIKLREGKYDGVAFDDQRVLLNALMKAQGLKLVRSNEAAIRSTLLVLNVPGTGPVTTEEIDSLLDTGVAP